MRIISTTCSNTEIVVTLGKSDWLVGVDEHSDFPPELVGSLPKVGPDLGIDPAKALALKPDLVLASLTVPGHEKVVANLQLAGLRIHAAEPINLKDVYRDIEHVASLLDCADRGLQLTAQMRTQMPARAVDSRPPRLLIQWWPKPVIAAAQQSWVTDMIELAGGQNAAAGYAQKSLPLEDEAVADMNPDAIIIAWCGVKTEKYRPEVIYRNPAFSQMRAVRERRVFCIPEARLGRPGPRLVEGYRALCEVLDVLA
jgi:iron complex transport system substrate-binding protein